MHGPTRGGRAGEVDAAHLPKLFLQFRDPQRARAEREIAPQKPTIETEQNYFCSIIAKQNSCILNYNFFMSQSRAGSS
jgi:hypothetical protein